jgi:hypothetical protein
MDDGITGSPFKADSSKLENHMVEMRKVVKIEQSQKWNRHAR